MDTLTHIINGFAVCLQPINLWYTFLGVFLGTIVGVLSVGDLLRAYEKVLEL